LENGALPRLQKDIRRLLLTAPDYCLNDGILYHSRVAKSKRTHEMNVFSVNFTTKLPKFIESQFGNGTVNNNLENISMVVNT
jgi:hypothetical protein